MSRCVSTMKKWTHILSSEFKNRIKTPPSVLFSRRRSWNRSQNNFAMILYGCRGVRVVFVGVSSSCKNVINKQSSKRLWVLNGKTASRLFVKKSSKSPTDNQRIPVEAILMQLNDLTTAVNIQLDHNWLTNSTEEKVLTFPWAMISFVVTTFLWPELPSQWDKECPSSNHGVRESNQPTSGKKEHVVFSLQTHSSQGVVHLILFIQRLLVETTK